MIDGRVDGEAVPESVPESKRADPNAVAAESLRLVELDPSAWSFEVDLRPWGDDGFRTWR